LLAWPIAARADLRDAVNWARLQGCHTPRAPEKLRASGQLDAAALRMAQGETLRAAVAASGYLDSESSVLHLSGSVGEGDVARLLTANYCRSLLDPKFSDLGVMRRGREVWLVLAAPASVPSAGDAVAVGRQILGLVNAQRARGRRCGNQVFSPVAPLVLNPALSAAALAHSRDMAEHHEFEHRGHDGSSPAQRVESAGYGTYTVVGENIAAGAMTATEVTEGWLQSPPHCENIMDARFTDIGIAFAINLASEERVYWTQDFAAGRHTTKQ
jgi:uncharacterized protein YkwD